MTTKTQVSHGGPGTRFLFLFDVLFVYTLILWVVWSTHLSSDVVWFWPAIGSLILYLGIGSPILQQLLSKKMGLQLELQSTAQSNEQLFFEARGLGNPLTWLRKTTRSKAISQTPWLLFGATLTVLTLSGTVTIIELVERERLVQAFVIAIPLLLTLGGGLLLIMVRWDNFVTGLKSIQSLILFGLILITAVHFALQYYSLNYALSDTEFPLTTDLSATELWEDFSLFTLASRFFQYLPWSWVQMYFFLGVIQVSLIRAFGDHAPSARWLTILMTGFLFALIHLPNIWLFMGTLIIGIYLAYCYMKTRNIFVVAIPHALFACMFAELLPVSLSPMIRSYEGPALFYEWGRLFVFVSIPILLIAGTSFILRTSFSTAKAKSAASTFACSIALGYSALVFAAFPDSSSGPSFSWSRYGNAHTWALNDLEITGRKDKTTSYKTRGVDPYLESQPINLIVQNQLNIDLNMEVGGLKSKTRAYLYFDMGTGFENSAYKPFPLTLKPGLNRYSIVIPFQGRLARLRIDPTTQANVDVVMQSLELTADSPPSHPSK